MTFPGELWHIVRKDARQSRWLLGAFVVLAIAATFGAVAVEGYAGGRLQLAAGLMIVIGPIAAASIIQADSPIRPDAFWASKPFRRSAMLAAKLVLVALVLLLLPLVGQWLGLMAFDVPRDEQWKILIASAGTYGFVLLLAIFLAALTPELRSFLLAVVAFLIAALAMSIALSGDAGSVWGQSGMRTLAGAIGLIGVIALLLLLYLRRGLRRVRTLGVAALVLLLAGTLSGSGPEPSQVASGGTSRVVAGSPAISVEVRDTARIRREGRFQLRITLTGASGNARYRLDHARAQFFLHNGTTTSMPLWVFGPTVLRTGKLVLPGVSTVHENMERFSGPSADRDQMVLDEVRRAAPAGIDSVRVTGDLTPVQPRVFATLPLREGASVVRNGQSTHITALNRDGPDDALRLSTKAVGTASSSRNWANDVVGPKLYLVDARRREGIALQRTNSRSNLGLLVLPGVVVHENTLNYRLPNDDDPSTPQMDDGWWQHATLLLVDWEDGPSVPVSASSVPLPPEPPEARRGARVMTGSASSPMRAYR
jgi:hypothetical protein